MMMTATTAMRVGTGMGRVEVWLAALLEEMTLAARREQGLSRKSVTRTEVCFPAAAWTKWILLEMGT